MIKKDELCWSSSLGQMLSVIFQLLVGISHSHSVLGLPRPAIWGPVAEQIDRGLGQSRMPPPKPKESAEVNPVNSAETFLPTILQVTSWGYFMLEWNLQRSSTNYEWQICKWLFHVMALAAMSIHTHPPVAAVLSRWCHLLITSLQFLWWSVWILVTMVLCPYVYWTIYLVI